MQDEKNGLMNYIVREIANPIHKKDATVVMKNLECLNAVYSILPKAEKAELLKNPSRFVSGKFQFRGMPDTIDCLVENDEHECRSGEGQKNGVFLTDKASYAIDFTKSILFAYDLDDVKEDREIIDCRVSGYWKPVAERMEKELEAAGKEKSSTFYYEVDAEVYKSDTIDAIPNCDDGTIYTRTDPLEYCKAEKIFVLCSKEDKDCVMLPEGLDDKVVSVHEVEWELPMSKKEIKKEIADFTKLLRH